MNPSLQIGLIINPLAGLGGSLAMKGSDGENLRQLARDMPAEQRRRALERVERALAPLRSHLDKVAFSTWGGVMGEEALTELAIPARVLGGDGGNEKRIPTANDTRLAAATLKEGGVDILVFAGGDGTARDVFDVLGSGFPVLGIPCGVKMHSGVFAVSPEAAGELLVRLVDGGLVGLQLREVRDIDEEAFRHDVVKARFYGEMLVPSEGHYLQQTKVGGRESPDLVAAEIVDWLSETMRSGTLYLMGPGSTTAAIMASLGLPNTLLGVDAICDGQLVASDANEAELLQLLQSHSGESHIIVTAIGGQGHIFGRGNQQFSPSVIRTVGLENITVVAAKSKITGLEGRPLLVDTNDPELDRDLSGYRSILTGYDDQILYRVASA